MNSGTIGHETGMATVEQGHGTASPVKADPVTADPVETDPVAEDLHVTVQTPQDAAGSEERADGPDSLAVRVIEAVLFSAAEPVREADLARRLQDPEQLRAALKILQSLYENRGVELFKAGDAWAFRTAPDLSDALKIERSSTRKLSRAAVETLAVIAYHQPVTRAEIEEIRGVGQSRGTLDVLLEAGWIKPGRRRQTPGRPVTWATTQAFLDHFGLENVKDLPGVADLKASGLLDKRPAIEAFRGVVASVGDEDLADDTADSNDTDADAADESGMIGDPVDEDGAGFDEPADAADDSIDDPMDAPR